MIPEVDWLLDVLSTVASDQPADHPLYRVDRNTAQVYETGDSVDMSAPLKQRKSELQRANFVGIRRVSQANAAMGTEFDARTDQVFSLRLEGLHWLEGGHIDPEDENGVDFEALLGDIKDAIWDDRHHPDIAASDIAHYDLMVMNEDDQSADYRDFFRYEFDIVFRGKQALP